MVDEFLEDLGSENIVGIAYHMNWPGAGNDPLHLNNPSENLARKNYYIVEWVYWLQAGQQQVYPLSTSNMQSVYNQQSAVDAPLELDLDVSVGSDSIQLNVHVTAEDYFSGSNLKLRAALVALAYEVPGSGWTYTHCENAMLDMAPDANGLNFSISPSQTIALRVQFPIPSITPLDNLAIVVFVQNDATREVLQVKKSVLYPNLSVFQSFIFDMVGGNGNMIPEPGETCDLWVTLYNQPTGAVAEEVTATLATDDPDITIPNSQSSFGDILPGIASTNSENPFTFEVSPNFETHYVTFYVDITANNGAYFTVDSIEMLIGLPDLLLVDDDGGADYETDFRASLDQLGVSYDEWEVTLAGTPSGEELLGYEKVIWFTGREASPLSLDEQDAIAYYLDNGGRLFISSENLGDDIGGSDFYADYMHAQPGEDHISILTLNGVAGNPISDGTNITLIGGAYYPDSQSSIIPDGEAEAMYLYTNPAQDCGALNYSGDYMLVYTAFSFECLHPNIVTYTFRSVVLGNILDWFDSQTEVNHITSAEFPDEFAIVSINPNPFNPETSIHLSIPEKGLVNVEVYNLLGQRVAVIYSGEMNPGAHMLTFDGAHLSSGMYLLRLNTPDGMVARKMVLMK